MIGDVPMTPEEKLQAEMDDLNAECAKCQQDFAKAGIPLSARMCNACSTGIKLHQLGMKTSTAEKKWGNIDWNSSRWKTYYHG